MKNNPNSPTIIDVRQSWEFENHHVSQAINIPLMHLPLQLQELRAMPTPLFLYSNDGKRSSRATTLLQMAGIEKVIDAGSMKSLLQ